MRGYADLSKLGDEFWNKAKPTVLLGMGIWFFSTLIYGGYFILTNNAFRDAWLFPLITLYAFLWISVALLSYTGRNSSAFVLYLICGWIAGLLQYKVSQILNELYGIHIAIQIFFILSLTSVLITCIILVLGMYYKERMREKWYYLITFVGSFIFIFNIALMFLFGFNLINMVFSIVIILWISFVKVYDGLRLSRDVEEGYWMKAVFIVFLNLAIVGLKPIVSMGRQIAKKHRDNTMKKKITFI